MCRILFRVNQLGAGLPLPARANALDAGFDVYAAADVTFPPDTVQDVPLGFTYRLTEPVFVRNGMKYGRGLIVVNKGSGLSWLKAQAIYFDGGYQPPLDAPTGIQLIMVNHSPFEQVLKRGRKVAQLVMSEYPIPELVSATIEEMAAIPPADTRGAGRRGSSG